MLARCRVTELNKAFDKDNDKFPFSLKEFAHMLKYMSDNINDFEPYKPAFDVFEKAPQMSKEEPRDMDDAKTQIDGLRK